MDTFKVNKGARVSFRGKNWVITAVLDLESVVLRDESTGETVRATVAELNPLSSDNTVKVKFQPLDSYTQDQWDKAEKRFTIIKPLLELNRPRTAQDVKETSEQSNTSPATLYRWLSAYENTHRLSALIPTTRKDKSKSRLSNTAESLIEEVIEKYYKGKKKLTVAKAYDKLVKIAKTNDLSPPSHKTFARRINALRKIDVHASRESRQSANDKYGQAAGKYDEAKFPLSVVQIDHTPVDLIFVDEEDRESIGRAWLTVAICVFSRIVCGYHLSYEAPSAMSVAQCLIHSILPKDIWLSDLEIEASWPIWGIMSNIHADNGKDFRTKSLDLSCREYGININWRPLGKSSYGGHIERLLGTFNADIHALDGSTFSNPKDRGKYDSESHAVFTLKEFDRWLCVYITKTYHQDYHRGIDMPPIAKLEQSLMGDDENLGIGLPDRITDEKRLRLDFLPVIYRSVQRHGIEIDYIRYYSTAISRWIKEKNPSPNSKDGKFVVKRDPRDITRVYFLDPEIHEYIEVPCVNRGASNITLWDLRNATKHAKKQGHSKVDQDLIFRAQEELEEIERQARRKTKKTRRNKQRRKQASDSLDKESNSQQPPPTVSEGLNTSIFSETVEPFDDIRGG